MSEITKKTINKTRTLIDVAIVTLASIAWADVVKTLLKMVNPIDRSSIKAKFIYAIIITIAVVAYTIYSYKIFGKNKDEKSPHNFTFKIYNDVDPTFSKSFAEYKIVLDDTQTNVEEES
jgi:hypothetical protein